MTGTAKRQAETAGKIRVALAGLGNCASSLIEGLNFYRQHPARELGLLFSELCGYRVADLEIVAAFDISARKVGRPVREAIYAAPNNFRQLDGVWIGGMLAAAANLNAAQRLVRVLAVNGAGARDE